VCLVPHNHSAFNEGSFPLKALEYLGAGLRVVATNLAAVRWVGSPDIAIEDEPTAFVTAVRKALKAPGGKMARERLQAFARRHTWTARPGPGILARRVGAADGPAAAAGRCGQRTPSVAQG
jgi:teichuronic acid biosynthesis glycosyltransferase TuaH